VSELEVHNALLTVYETFLFAFKASTGGHHGYGKSKSPESAEILNMNDKLMNKVSVIAAVMVAFICCLLLSLKS
jgi:hypothetical protein